MTPGALLRCNARNTMIGIIKGDVWMDSDILVPGPFTATFGVVCTKPMTSPMVCVHSLIALPKNLGGGGYVALGPQAHVQEPTE